MKTILISAIGENERTAFLRGQLENDYKVILLTDKAALNNALEKRNDLEALIIDAPGDDPGAAELIAHVKELNSYVYALPVMLLTEEERMSRDERFLDDTAIGLIEKGDSKKIVRQKIDVAVNVINSVSFTEFSKMLKVLPSLIYLKDAKGRYAFCSQYLNHLDGYDDPNWTIRGKTDMEIRRDKENARKAYASDMQIVATGKGTSYIIEEHEDGVKEYLQLIKEPLKDDHGRVTGIIAIINNVTEQETMRRELQEKSTTDELTGLYNRTYFDECSAKIGDMPLPLTVISADCDGLKTVNDRYGHMVGDEYLRMAATLFRTVLPRGSLIFRTGGDEFIVLMPGTDGEKAKDYIDLLNADAPSYKIKDKTLSVSLGCATLRTPEDSLSDCVALSDAEMYKNKHEKKRRQK